MTNAYQRRRTQHSLKRRVSGEPRNFLKHLEIESVQKFYEDAWFALHGSRISVRHSHGWYYVGKQAFRQSGITAATMMLEGKIHERDLNAPVEVL